jgi:hypothetical protein
MPWAGANHAAFTAAHHTTCERGLGFRVRFFCFKNPGWFRGPCGREFNILDPVRLALARPPNLEPQYATVQKKLSREKH